MDLPQVGRTTATAGLPDPSDERLPRAPLKVVAFEIRYSHSPNATDLQAGVDLQKRLGGRELWQLTQLQRQVVTFTAAVAGASPPTTESQGGGWRLTSADEYLAFSLTPESATLETTQYKSWNDFSIKILALLDSIAEVVRPQAELRLGLRYINRIDEPHVETSGDWQKWIDPDVVGIVRHPLGPFLAATQQQLNVNLGDGIKATIGHGFYREPLSTHLTYVMDFDVYLEGTSRFETGEIVSSTVKLHQVSLQLFQSLITAEMYSFLQEPRK